MRIAYIVLAHPLPLRTFILNEMVEVQNAGHELVLAPVYRASRSKLQQKRYELVRPAYVLPAPLLNLKIIVDALLTILSCPVRVFNVMLELHRLAGLNIYQHCAILGLLPKSLAIARGLVKLKVNHIHAHFATHTATVAAIAGRISGIPYSFTAHAYDIYSKAPQARNDTLIFKLAHARHVFAVSQYGTRLLRGKLPPADRKRVQTAYVGIPMDLFAEEPPLPFDGQLRILCVTRFLQKKGLDTLIDACALLRNHGLAFQLHLYGGGSLRESLVKQINRLGLHEQVLLGGYISQEQVARAIKDCHVFVMPCRQDHNGDMDGIPTVFMEAMAIGRPVISCPISGIPELVVHGQTGLLVPPDDPAALAAAIRKLSEDDALRIRLGRQARALVETQHDQRINTGKLLQVIASDKSLPHRTTSPVVSSTQTVS